MRDVRALLLRRSVRDGDCLRWMGRHTPKGYGYVGVAVGKTRAVHRIAYELFIGPIPDGLEIEHVYARGCRFRDCINPEHLEAVTHKVNAERSEPARRDRCGRGHEYTPENLILRASGDLTWRRCRTCKNEMARAYRVRKRARDEAA